ncbi:MAG: hypothetical protein CVU11_02515 [Bacteroidetes bacterium HGW-Bacteroidetes-6]|jgi:CRP/FNR family transcriptional regulator|nr:MAG: hypothetical protein CVU11_02515 [Bacteroidetes bacterium HGW-Bacteroidetes-6]
MDDQKRSCPFCDTKSACFKKLSPLELEVADMRRAELRYRKGEHIAKQGSFVTHILYLQKGLVKVYMEMEGDNDLILNIFSGGDLIGLPNLFTNAPLQYSVAAIEDSVVCAIDKKVIEDLVKNNGDFAQSIIENINGCTLYHYKRLITASQKQLNGRMADALLHLSEKVYKSDDFNMALSRKELAELAGMSMMSAVRVIKDLEQNGIIAENGGRISILDRSKLESLSKYG